jgi:hypothetical protein
MIKKNILIAVIIFLFSGVAFNINAADYKYDYESIAAPRPDPHKYDNSTAKPDIGIGEYNYDGMHHDMDYPQQYDYDISQYKFPINSEYQRQAGVWALNTADWYLNSLNNRIQLNYNYNYQKTLNKAIADVNRHKVYYKQCIGYEMFNSRDIIDNFYKSYKGAKLSRMMIVYSDSLLTTCYHRR